MRGNASLAFAGSAALLLALSAAPAQPPTIGRAADYAPWQGFLARYLDKGAPDGITRLRYAQVTPEDRRALAAFLGTMQAEKVSALGRDGQRAFWINLYNARTVAAVLDHYPIKSILDINIAGSPKKGPWDAKLLQVEGRSLSLNDIETGILRAEWKDPRIHFALNCASLGCPDLASEAFTPANTEALLEAGARKFIGSARGASFTGGALKLSSLFDWYKSDFGKTDREVLEFLARYAPPAKAKQLREYQGKISYDYDWNLNASPK
jgi:hypothetical protein